MWFAVWVVLVAGSLVGALLLGRHLWYSGKALIAQLQETSAVLDRLQTKVDELEQLREPDGPFTPALTAAEPERDRWREVRSATHDRRDGRRAARRAQTYRRWRDLLHLSGVSWPPGSTSAGSDPVDGHPAARHHGSRPTRSPQTI